MDNNWFFFVNVCRRLVCDVYSVIVANWLYFTLIAYDF